MGAVGAAEGMGVAGVFWQHGGPYAFANSISMWTLPRSSSRKTDLLTFQNKNTP